MVLISALNVQAIWGQTLDSQCAQTYSDFEVMIVDDPSQDHTEAIAQSYEQRLTLTVLGLATNYGVAGAHNAEVNTITSRSIDVDNLAQSTRLEKQVAFLAANPHIDVRRSWMERFYDAQEFVS